MFKKLQQWPQKKLDTVFHQGHEDAFQKIDCLSCANCCKTTPALITQADMQRISKHLGLSVSQFLQQYVVMDEDGDFVFKQTPCFFLKEDNSCEIYAVRPKACREYPHTNHKNMKAVLDITYHNTFICPAVAVIVDEILLNAEKG